MQDKCEFVKAMQKQTMLKILIVIGAVCHKTLYDVHFYIRSRIVMSVLNRWQTNIAMYSF